jgi:hypothetical protein
MLDRESPCPAEIANVPFALRCSNCNALLKAPDKAAGRTLPCPGCKTPMTFPKTPPAQPAAPNPGPAAAPSPRPKAPAPAAMPNLSLDDPPAPKPVVPDLSLDAPATPAAALPNLSLDDLPGLVGDLPKMPAANAPARMPAPTSALSDLSLDDLPGLVGDDPPAAKKPAAPPPGKPAAKPKPGGGALPDLDLDALPGLKDDPPAKPAIPKMELEDEIPVLDDLSEEEDEELPELESAEEEDLDEVVAVSDEEGAEELDEVEEVQEVEELTEVTGEKPRKKRRSEQIEEAGEDDRPRKKRRPERVEELEEVDEPDEEEDRPRKKKRRSALGDSQLLQLRQLFVRGQKMSLGEAVVGRNEAGHDLIDPESRKKVGTAREVRDTTQQVLRHLVHASLIEAKVEITERGDVLATIKRAPHLGGLFTRAMLEILDPDGRVLGMFEDRPFSRLMQKPMSIVNRRNEMLLQIRSDWTNGRMEFLDLDGEVLGELKAGDGSGQFKIALVRGRSCRLSFRTKLDDRPEDKLCFLAAIIGLDLFDRDR